jgi:hypothetical protein
MIDSRKIMYKWLFYSLLIVNFGCISMLTLLWLLWSPFYRNDTDYAQNFTLDKFSSFTCGMKTEDVLLTIGKPLLVLEYDKSGKIVRELKGDLLTEQKLLNFQDSAEDIDWSYSRQGKSNISWSLLGVKFFPNGSLKQTYKREVAD